MLHKPDVLTKFAQPFLIGNVKSGLVAKPAAAIPRTASLSWAEVARHNTSADCWCVIHDQVYNLTSFLADHPGGKAILAKYAGMDATRAFDAAGHPKDIAESLGLQHLCLGPVSG